MRMGGMGCGGSQVRRPWRHVDSRDAGELGPRKEFNHPANYWCHSMFFHPTKRNDFATVTAQGMRNGPGARSRAARLDELTKPPHSGGMRSGRDSIGSSKTDVLIPAARKAEDVSVFPVVEDGGDTWKNSGSIRETKSRDLRERDLVIRQSRLRSLCGIDGIARTEGGRSGKTVSRWY